MKSKEEIEKLAEKEYPIVEDIYRELYSENKAYIKGYTQCQLDMALQIQELQTKIEDLTAENEQYERELNELTIKNK